jgi:hypothetical protein
MVITFMCKLISYSYSNHSAITQERILVPIDWDIGWTPIAGMGVLGNITVEAEELVFLMKTICFFWGKNWCFKRIIKWSLDSLKLKVYQLPHWTRFDKKFESATLKRNSLHFWKQKWRVVKFVTHCTREWFELGLGCVQLVPVLISHFSCSLIIGLDQTFGLIADPWI